VWIAKAVRIWPPITSSSIIRAGERCAIGPIFCNASVGGPTRAS
jgi:hypothetical protein